MDPIAHTLTGATLAVAGLRDKTPLATAVLLIGANAPDVDALSYFGEPFQSLAVRRGATHGILALSIWPFVITCLILLWDRCYRLRRHPAAQPARAGPVLMLAAIAVVTHPTLDWLNNYGLRWLMPFDGRWFYGDAVFIVDPWLWLGLGAMPFLAGSLQRPSLLAWSVFWLAASLLVMSVSDIPLGSRALWLGAIAVLVALRLRRPPTSDRAPGLALGARVLLVVAAAYVGAMVATDLAERRAVREALMTRGVGPVEAVMVAPVAANPFAGEVVVATAERYYIGKWHWLSQPRLSLDAASIARVDSDPIYQAATTTIEARRFLTWARFPFGVIETDGERHTVKFLDARYAASGRLYGPTVTVDSELRATCCR